MMVIFNDNVKALCIKISEEIGEDPYVNIATGKGAPFWNWQKHESMVRDWLVTEAFSKVRSKYWSDQNRSVKSSVAITDDKKMS